MSKKQPPPIRYRNSTQTDAAVGDFNCPTCGRGWDGLHVRVCRLCGLPIGAHDSWQVVPVGPSVFTYQHRGACPARDWSSTDE